MKIKAYRAQVYVAIVVVVVLMTLLISLETHLFWVFMAWLPSSVVIAACIRRLLAGSSAVRWRVVLVVAALFWAAPVLGPMALDVLEGGVPDTKSGWYIFPPFAHYIIRDIPALGILSLIGWLACCFVFFAGRVFPIARWIHWGVGVCLLSGGFFWFLLVALFLLMPLTGAAPPGAMSVKGHVRVTMKEDATLLYTETYEVIPRAKCEAECWSIEEAKAFDSQRLREDGAVRVEKIFVQNFHDRPIFGARIEIERLRRPEVISLGLLRAKFKVALDPINLRVVTYRTSQETSGIKARNLYEETEWQGLDTLGNENSKITMVVELPKNAMIVTSPEGKAISLPDKDVTTVLLDDTNELEVYYLRRLRVTAVKMLLGTASKSDLILKVVAWCFWPVAVISIGLFQQNLTNWLIAPLKKAFTKKPRRIGF